MCWLGHWTLGHWGTLDNFIETNGNRIEINFNVPPVSKVSEEQIAKKVQCNEIKTGWVSFSCGHKSMLDNSLLHVSVLSLSHQYYSNIFPSLEHGVNDQQYSSAPRSVE